jgi:D-sedoheptulose 7-phosphate isomerase
MLLPLISVFIMNLPNFQKANEYLGATFDESLAAKHRFFQDHRKTLVEAAAHLGHSIKHGGKVMIFGNGGSAADAQHMAAEMVGRMLIERKPLPALALTTDTSNITAIANDYSYDVIFSKQVEGLGKKEDTLVAISTSGNSVNVLRAVEAGKKIGCKIIGVTGRDGGKLGKLSDFHLNVALGSNSSRIQETHIFIAHSLVDLLDQFFLDDSFKT